MTDTSPGLSPLRRRGLLGALTAALPAAAAGRAAAQAPAAAPSAPASPPTPPVAPHAAWLFFNAAEARLVEAMVARLVPADALGPGAKEAGVAAYIDRQLAGAWGAGNNFYAKGPFREGTPQQGYQLAFTPAAMFRTALPLVDQRSAALNKGLAFADCPPATQDDMLTAMQAGRFDLSPVPSAAFFAALLDATMEGFFADPIYGGNQGMVGWRLVGFPGAYDSYEQTVELWGMTWPSPPISIAEGGAGHAMEAHEARPPQEGRHP